MSVDAKGIMVYCCAGAAGMFITSIIAKILDIKIDVSFSDTGHAHNLGRGNWKSPPTSRICLVGDYWELNFRPGCDVYCVHRIPYENLKERHPELRVVLISATEKDHEDIAELFVRKAYPDLLTEEEYNTLRGSDWPPYSKNLINEDPNVFNDIFIMTGMPLITDWFNTYDKSVVDSEVPFRCIFTETPAVLLDRIKTAIQVTGPTPNDTEILEMIDAYQKINNALYFKKLC